MLLLWSPLPLKPRSSALPTMLPQPLPLDDAVHSLQVENQGAGHTWRSPSIAKVAPGRDGPDRNAVFTGHGQHPLYLIDRRWRHGTRRRMLFRRLHSEVVIVTNKLVGIGEHVSRPDDCTQCIQRGIEGAAADLRWQRCPVRPGCKCAVGGYQGQPGSGCRIADEISSGDHGDHSPLVSHHASVARYFARLGVHSR